MFHTAKGHLRLHERIPFTAKAVSQKHIFKHRALIIRQLRITTINPHFLKKIILQIKRRHSESFNVPLPCPKRTADYSVFRKRGEAESQQNRRHLHERQKTVYSKLLTAFAENDVTIHMIDLYFLKMPIYIFAHH